MGDEKKLLNGFNNGRDTTDGVGGRPSYSFGDIAPIEGIRPAEEKTIFHSIFDGLRDYHNKVGKLPSREHVPMVCVGQLMLALRKQGLVIKKDNEEL